MNSKIRELVENSTTNELNKYLKLTDIRPVPVRKREMVEAVVKIISDKDQLLFIWDNLNALDKELLEELLRADGIVSSEDIRNIYVKHNVKYEGNFGRFFYSVKDIFSENSKARLFFIDRGIPQYVFDILKSQLKEIEIKYTPININVDDYINSKDVKFISIRESFEKDFTAVIKLVNSAKLKVTQALELPNKAAMVKINEALNNKEILNENNYTIEDIRTIDKTIRCYAIYKLLKEGNILGVEGTSLILGKNAQGFLCLNIIDKCKALLGIYLNSSIDELSRIFEMKLITQYHRSFSECRKLLLNYLKKAPIDEWIDISEFYSIIKKTYRNFLLKAVGSIGKYSEYERYYYDIDHWTVSERFIDVVLIEYLSTVGVVDLIIDEYYDDDRDCFYNITKYLKLTPLGSCVLGINDDYENTTISEDRGLIVQPNFEIMVPEGSKKESYCITLDGFAEKKCEDVMSIYTLNFKSMVKALDNDISIEYIIDFLKENSKNEIPANVLDALEKWKADSKKIKIRTVTIVETDDKYLIEELKSYKGINKYMQSELPYVFEIEDGSANKVKREIEKKGHFCIKN